MLNVSGHGTVGQDPELKETPNGVKVAYYSFATYKKNPKDETKPITEWYKVIAWGDQAELVMNNLKKGSKIHIVGVMQTRSYENKEGKKVEVVEVIQNEFWLEPSKEKKSEFDGPFDDDLPF